MSRGKFTKNDFVGKQFGRLSVVERRPYNACKNGNIWKCICECGNAVHTNSWSLKSGETKSCGCWSRNIGDCKRRHGSWNTDEYKTFMRMNSRCNNPNTRQYHRYGGRGIRLMYSSFEDFIADVGPKPTKKHSIDRINNDGHYEPGNCRWALPQQQANNTSRNKFITYNGQTKTVSDWARSLGLTFAAIDSRLRDDWSIEETLTTPLGGRNAKKN